MAFLLLKLLLLLLCLSEQISQVASYAIKAFTSGGKIDFSALPGALMGALGIKGVNNMSNRDLEEAIEQLRKNPDSLDDAQKAALLKRVRVNKSLRIFLLFSHSHKY